MRVRRKPIATVTWYEELGREVTQRFYDHESLNECIEDMRNENTVYFVCILSLSRELPARTNIKHREAI